MAKLVNASIGFRRTIVTNFQAWLYTLPVALLEVILLSITSIVDPPHQYETINGDGNGIGEQVLICTQNSRAFFYVQVIFHGK
jgi:hypothetical protein